MAPVQRPGGRGRREDPGAAADPARRPGALPHRPGRRPRRRRRQHLPVQGPQPATTSALGREFPTAEDWGRPRNTIADGEGVDAAFAGPRREDLRVQRRPVRDLLRAAYVDAEVEGHPRPVSEHWGGLTAVGPGLRPTTASPTCSSRRTPSGNRRYVSVLGLRLHPAGPGLPADRGPGLLGRPAGVPRRGAAPGRGAVRPGQHAVPRRLAVRAAQRRRPAPGPTRGRWPGSGPACRWAPRPHRCAPPSPARTARRTSSPATSSPATRTACSPRPSPSSARWGRIRNTITSASRDTAVDAAFVWRRDDDLPVLRRPVRPLLRRRLPLRRRRATRSRSSTTCATRSASATCRRHSSRRWPTGSRRASRR